MHYSFANYTSEVKPPFYRDTLLELLGTRFLQQRVSECAKSVTISALCFPEDFKQTYQLT